MITKTPKPGLVKDRMPRIVAVAVCLDSSHNRSRRNPHSPAELHRLSKPVTMAALDQQPLLSGAVVDAELGRGSHAIEGTIAVLFATLSFSNSPAVPLPPDMSSNQDEGHRQEVRVRPHVHSTLCPCVPHRLPCHVCWAGLLQPQHATRLGSVDRFCCSGRRNVWPIPYWSCVHHQYVRHWQLRESVWLHVLTIVVLAVSGCKLGLCCSFSALEPSCLLATVCSVLQCDTLAPR